MTPIGVRAHEHFQDKDSKYNMTTRTLSLTHVTLYKQLAFHRWTVVRSVRDFDVLAIERIAYMAPGRVHFAANVRLKHWQDTEINWYRPDAR